MRKKWKTGMFKMNKAREFLFVKKEPTMVIGCNNHGGFFFYKISCPLPEQYKSGVFLPFHHFLSTHRKW